MPKNVFLVTGNHNEIRGISDLLFVIYSALAGVRTDVCVHVSKKPQPNEINFIIEEFSSREFCNTLVSIKNRYPQTKFILLLTELATGGSYNLYELQDRAKFALHNCLAPYFALGDEKRGLSRQVECDVIDTVGSILFEFSTQSLSASTSPIRLADSASNLARMINRFLLLGVNKATDNKVGRRFSSIFDIARYWKARFENTKYLIDLDYVFNEVFIMHHSVLELMRDAFGQKIEVFPYRVSYPAEAIARNIDVYFSGTFSAARGAKIAALSSAGLEVRWDTDFSDISREIGMSQSKYALHLPRYVGWEYSSPTRSLAALRVGTIPLFLDDCVLDKFEKNLNLPILSALQKNPDGSYNREYAADFFEEMRFEIPGRLRVQNEENAIILQSFLSKIF